MKKLLLFIGFLLTTMIGFSQAGDILFSHTVTSGNIAGFVSYIDHPALNNNPSAKVLISHDLTGGIYNNHSTGLYFSASEQKWSILYEEMINPTVGDKYSVYVQGTEGNIYTYTATGGFYYELMDIPGLNNNPSANPILTTVWGTYNPGNYSLQYSTTGDKWWIYHPNTTINIPTGTKFNILVEPALVSYNPAISFMHQATSSTIIANYTEIDHPLLNNNPNALFVFSHIFAHTDVPNSGISCDHTLGIWYKSSTERWTIFTEDHASFPVDAAFSIALQLPKPANDDPGGNIEVTVGAHGSTCTSPTYMTNVGATDSTGMSGLPTPSCGNYEGGDIFYWFVAPPSGQIKIHRTNEGNWDALKFSLHQPSWSNEVACETITGGTTESVIVTGLTPGVNCGLRFWEWNNNDFGVEGFCVIEHDPSAGIADAVIEGFNMYPNPVENTLYINATNKIDAISIYNLLGQEVLQNTPATIEVELDMSMLPTGTYVVKVQAGDQIGAYNLIKQ